MTKPTNKKEKFDTLRQQIIANSKDAKWAENQIGLLLSIQKDLLHEPTELIVPVKEVKESLDFGSCKISRTIRGYLFEAKGGMHTFVDNRMTSVCDMLQAIFDLHDKEDKTDDENIIYQNARDAILYVFQSPIFASLDERSLFDIAAAILRTFNDYAQECYTDAKPVDETEEDIRDNITFEQAGKAIEQIANAPLPPEEQENE